jgi:hypothetical protein
MPEIRPGIAGTAFRHSRKLGRIHGRTMTRTRFRRKTTLTAIHHASLAAVKAGGLKMAAEKLAA